MDEDLPGLDDNLLPSPFPEAGPVPVLPTTALTTMATPDVTARTDTLPTRPFLLRQHSWQCYYHCVVAVVNTQEQ